MEGLSESDIDARLGALGSPWHREGDAIVSERECEDFAAAVVLLNAIAAEAEAANHHPDILIHGYNKLRITLATHAAGGLTESDFALARTINTL